MLVQIRISSSLCLVVKHNCYKRVWPNSGWVFLEHLHCVVINIKNVCQAWFGTWNFILNIAEGLAYLLPKYCNFSLAEHFRSEYGESMVKKLQFSKETGNYFFLYLPSQKFLICPLITAWTRGESRLRAFYCIKAILNHFSLLKSKWLQISLLSCWDKKSCRTLEICVERGDQIS